MESIWYNFMLVPFLFFPLFRYTSFSSSMFCRTKSHHVIQNDILSPKSNLLNLQNIPLNMNRV